MLFAVRQRVTSKNSQRGQSVLALIWVFVWLAGMAAITYWCVSRTVPTLENKIQRNAEAAIAPIDNAQVAVSVSDRTATLSGKLSEESQRQALLSAAMGAEGVALVVDELILPAPMQTNATDENDVLISNNIKQTHIAPDVNTAKPNNNADIGAQALASLETNKATVPTVNTDNNDVVTTVQTAQASAASLDPPKLRILSQEDTLTFTGTVSNEDNLLQLIQLAMNTFNADYVVNSVQLDPQTAKAQWLPDLVDFLPQLNSLTDAGIEIVSTQITLSGKAPTQSAHDELINKALSELGTFSLVERISIEQNNESSATAQATVVTEVAAPTVHTEPSTSTTAPIENSTTLPNAALSNSTDDEVAKILADARAEIRSNTATATETTSNGLNKAESPELLTHTENEVRSDKPSTQNDTQLADRASIDAQRQSLTAEFEALDSHRILFESGSAVLTTQSRPVLETMAALFMEYPNVPIEIDGHTDASGNPSANIELSQARANAVRDILVELGVSIYRISAYGFGDGVPIADNGTDAGRRLNRRIEFLF